MSIPNYLYALANHKGPATVNAGGMSIPVKIGGIEHRSEYGKSDLCTFECLVVNEDQIQCTSAVDTALTLDRLAKQALNTFYGANPDAYVRQCLAKSAAKKTTVNHFDIKRVYFNDPVTVVIWADGTKTIVRCQDGDVYSKETGLALCIAKKALGNKGNFNDVFHKYIPEEEEEKVDGCEYCRCATRTDELYTVHTPGGNEVNVPINWCPVCGKRIPELEEETSND